MFSTLLTLLEYNWSLHLLKNTKNKIFLRSISQQLHLTKEIEVEVEKKTVDVKNDDMDDITMTTRQTKAKTNLRSPHYEYIKFMYVIIVRSQKIPSKYCYSFARSPIYKIIKCLIICLLVEYKKLKTCCRNAFMQLMTLSPIFQLLGWIMNELFHFPYLSSTHCCVLKEK